MKDQRIAPSGRPTFKTPDGVEHATWNAARKHLTGLDLLATLREAGPDLAESQLVAMRDRLLENWHVSRKASPSPAIDPLLEVRGADALRMQQRKR